MSITNEKLQSDRGLRHLVYKQQTLIVLKANKICSEHNSVGAQGNAGGAQGNAAQGNGFLLGHKNVTKGEFQTEIGKWFVFLFTKQLSKCQQFNGTRDILMKHIPLIVILWFQLKIENEIG